MAFVSDNNLGSFWGKISSLIKDYVNKHGGSGSGLPEGGVEGQVLKKTESGTEWEDDNTVVVNNTLTSDSTKEALSAAQGKALKDMIDEFDISFPTASDTKLGGVKIGQGIEVADDGTISAADDVVSPNFVRACKGDIPMQCVLGTFEQILYFVVSPLTTSGLSITDTKGDYHLCVHIKNTGVVGGGLGQADTNYYETNCSGATDVFDSVEDFDKYFNKAGNAVLKNDLIYYVPLSLTDDKYFVSVENNNATTVAKGFATLAEARAYMRNKMLKLSDGNVKSDEVVSIKVVAELPEVKENNVMYIVIAEE